MTHNLLEMARATSHAMRLRFLFTSSVCCVQSWPLSLGEVREDARIESKSAIGLGYSEANHVAERMPESSGLQVNSLHIRQVVH